MAMFEYELIRSGRKTLALYVRRDGRLEVRAPLRTSRAYIDEFVLKKRDWIENTRNRLAERQDARKTIRLTKEEEAVYKKQAKAYLQQKCRHFSGIMGLRPGEIKVNGAKSRWGSCNRKGSINFTYRLLLAPEELTDYVVVHELAHLKEMNHSAKFWSIVEQTMPDYRARRKKLREFERQVELIVRPD
ncbi:MAG TPA: SprT family zinc-dependent metalloprotease [Anaerovoracaceae bacterium]|nr:SprT family zinc-dependent metalloprotease [Anaerovoracaceae bacterium]